MYHKLTIDRLDSCEFAQIWYGKEVVDAQIAWMLKADRSVTLVLFVPSLHHGDIPSTCVQLTNAESP